MNTKPKLHFISIATTVAVACTGISQATGINGAGAATPLK